MEYSELKKRHFGTNDTNKKLTDEEIISSLEVIAATRNCDECKIRNCKWGTCNCSQITANAALGLINRQNAEIERLEKVLNGRDQLVNALNKCYKQAKSEAVKEFAEKLKNEINIRTTYSREQDKNVMRMIDNLVKEMTEALEWNQRKEDERNDRT